MTATQRINQNLAEDGTGYHFADLRDRFESALDEAVAAGESFVTIKIPSGSEFSASVSDVTAALAPVDPFAGIVDVATPDRWDG